MRKMESRTRYYRDNTTGFSYSVTFKFSSFQRGNIVFCICRPYVRCTDKSFCTTRKTERPLVSPTVFHLPLFRYLNILQFIQLGIFISRSDKFETNTINLLWEREGKLIVSDRFSWTDLVWAPQKDGLQALYYKRFRTGVVSKVRCPSLRLPKCVRPSMFVI